MPDIRDQGATEAHDHGLVNSRLKTIVSGAGIEMPNTLDPTFRQELDSLNALSGTAFDNAYLGDMERIHVADGAAFEAEARHGTNPELRAFAAETDRIVRRHLGEIRAVGPVRS